MIVITGATGKLGRHVVEELLKKVPVAEVAVAVRNPEKAADLAARGVEVRQADYNDPESLAKAFTGADKLLLISSSEVGKRAEQHQAVVDAAKKAGVRFIAYTSILGAETSAMQLATEHKATEELIRASGIPFAFLRNGWYIENYTENLGPALAHGAILGSADDGKIAAAARKDYAAAAVVVLTGSGHDNKVYELAGDHSFTMSELAADVSRQSGKSVFYSNLPQAEYANALTSFGLPVPVAEMLADSDRGISRGDLAGGSDDLRRLIGRPTTPVSELVAAAVR